MAKEYRPDIQGSKVVSHIHWIKKMLQVNYDFFHTKAVYGVLGFYSWGVIAQEGGGLDSNSEEESEKESEEED